MPRRRKLLCGNAGSALVEFAICLPLLVVFIVGIYDFSGAFNQKQKLEHAAQEGAVVVGAQPMNDIEATNSDPSSLQPVVAVIFNSLAENNVLPQQGQGTCVLPVTGAHVSGVQWKYEIAGCPDTLTITIDRGWSPASATAPKTVGSRVTVSYGYHWRFNSAIQLLFPGSAYAATTELTETATVHNQT